MLSRIFRHKSKIKKINLLFRGCNLCCPMCSMNANRADLPQILRDYPGASPGPELTIEEYKRVFLSLKKQKPIVSIGGGEPFLFKDITQLVLFLTGELQWTVGITTNATLLNQDILDALAPSGCGLTLSLDGLQATHDRIRGEGCFQKVTDTLRALMQMRRSNAFRSGVSALFVLHQNNYRETASVAELLLDDLRIDALTVSSLIFSTPEILKQHEDWRSTRNLDDRYAIHTPKGGVFARNELERMDFDDIWNTKRRLQKRYGSRLAFQPDFHSKDDLKQYFLTNELMPEYFGARCQPARQEIALLSNGDTLFFPGCFEIKLGNVREAPLQTIWEGRLRREIRDVLSEQLSPICAHCCANRAEKHL